jgi:hypothetical protein
MIAAANVFMAKTQSRQPGMVVTALLFFVLRLGAARRRWTARLRLLPVKDVSAHARLQGD